MARGAVAEHEVALWRRGAWPPTWVHPAVHVGSEAVVHWQHALRRDCQSKLVRIADELQGAHTMTEHEQGILLVLDWCECMHLPPRHHNE